MYPKAKAQSFSTLVLAIFLTSLTFLAGAIPASTSPAVVPDINQSIYDQIHAMTTNFDQAKAVALATSSRDFQSKTLGLGPNFNSVFDTWSYSIGPNGVVVSWKDVNVVYTLHNLNGTFTNIVVTENPTLTRILGVSVQHDVGCMGLCTQQTQAGLGSAPLSSTKSTQSSTSSPGNVGQNLASLPAVLGPVPDFGISTSSTSLSFVAGSSASSTITLNSLNGFVGSIALVAPISPNIGTVPIPGLSVNSITLMSGASGSSTLSVVTTPYTPSGVYTVNVKAVSGSLVHSVAITVTVQAQIQMSVSSPSPGSFTAGGSATSSISLTSFGYSGTVSLSAPVSPSVANGPGTSFNPGTITLGYGGTGSSTLTITTSSSTPSNTYTITVTANGGGGVVTSTSITINVQADFQISASSPFYLAPNGAASSTVTLNSYGLTGNIGLSANSPSGITTSFGTNPVYVTPGGSFTSSMSISVSSSMATGSYSFTVTGTIGSLSHGTTVTVNVCDPNSYNSGTWGGYTFRASCGGTSLSDIRGTWTVPSVIEPQQYWCLSRHCDITMTVSMADTEGDSNGHLAMAGTDSGEYCSIGCSFYYYGVYQIDSNAWVQCSTSISSGNQVTARVFNEGAPGLPSPYFDLYVTNNSNGQVCSSTGQKSAMSIAYYADFIADRPSIGGSITRLPKFDPITVTSCDVFAYVAPNQKCLDSFNEGYSSQYTMQNSGTTDITVNSVQSDNSFTITWKNSGGT